jgi:multiple sugar transport system permease protein
MRSESMGASAPAAARRPRRRRLTLAQSEALTGWLFIAPALLGFLVFYLFPTLRAIEISFTEWNLLRAPRFVGLDNYLRLFADPDFWNAVRVTGLYVLWNIPVQTTLGLLLAVLMDRLARGIALRTIVVLPYLISGAVVAMIWLWMLDPLLGVVNGFLGLIGVPRQGFLTSPDLAIVSIAGINTWKHTGFTALLFYTGLQAIPRSLYEAARLDGASETQIFLRITLPMLRPVLAFILVTSIIGSFQVFDTIAVTTAGGPAKSTSVIIWYIYENAFKFLKMGYASAASVVLFAALILVTLVQMRLLRAGSSDLS